MHEGVGTGLADSIQKMRNSLDDVLVSFDPREATSPARRSGYHAGCFLENTRQASMERVMEERTVRVDNKDLGQYGLTQQLGGSLDLRIYHVIY